MLIAFLVRFVTIKFQLRAHKTASPGLVFRSRYQVICHHSEQEHQARIHIWQIDLNYPLIKPL